MQTLRVNLDAESRALIYQGASVNQLAAIFRIKPEEIMRRLGDLEPVGTGRQGNPIYDLAQAAERIVPPRITPEMIDRYMRSVNHSRLPPMVSKHYWEGLRTRERYREEVDELWSTDDVIRVFSQTFQMLRATLMLLPDMLRDRGDLSAQQFRVVQRIADDSVEECRVTLVGALGKPSRGDEDRAGALAEAG